MQYLPDGRGMMFPPQDEHLQTSLL